MEIARLIQALDDVFDGAIVHHGYTDYIRDYEVIVYVTADPRTDIPPVPSDTSSSTALQPRCKRR
ncbi:hypothetical protein AB0B39_12265 [Micromonospora sp. NPDC049114]|uniref:YxiG-like protein n=1 Tax=Micromonospora sp. NPDC049114 TaxID=3155498 RepID=UPI00340678EE